MNTILTAARTSRAAVALLALTGAPSIAQEAAPAAPATTAPAEKPKPLSAGDKKFIKDVSKSFYFEMQLASSAKTNGNSEATKKFAEQVNKELLKGWEELGVIAKEKGEMMPAELSGGDKGSAERVKKAKGDGFDKLFFREILKEAKGVERDFESAAKSATDPALKQFATNYLAIVKGHVTDGDKAEKESTKKK